jgi:hypothetical protein
LPLARRTKRNAKLNNGRIDTPATGRHTRAPWPAGQAFLLGRFGASAAAEQAGKEIVASRVKSGN